MHICNSIRSGLMQRSCQNLDKVATVWVIDSNAKSGPAHSAIHQSARLKPLEPMPVKGVIH